MKQTQIIMDMPVTLEVVESSVTSALFDEVFAYFKAIDARFSTFKANSEISRINRGELALAEASEDMKIVFKLCEQMRRNTGGYFNILQEGFYDPAGLVKGWAIFNAAEMVRQAGFENFYVEAGGDFQVVGKNSAGQNWRVGIRNPFNLNEII